MNKRVRWEKSRGGCCGVALTVLLLGLAACASAGQQEPVSDSSRMRLGIIASMVPGSTSGKELTKEGHPMLYFVLPQHGMPETKRYEFVSHAQLRAFFEGFPTSARNNGLWITRFAPSTWALSDTGRMAALTREARHRKALVHVCEAYLAKAGDSIVTWDCKQLSP